jgi:hypothetical protein
MAGIPNIYETRTMMQAINLMLPVKTFFRDTFFPNVQTFVTEKVDVDFKKGKRAMAPFVARRRGGITVDRVGFKTDTYTTPYIAPQRLLTIDDLANRLMGEDIYSTRTPEQRAQELLAQDLVELEQMIVRREEWMCRQLLLEGTVTIKGWVDKIGQDYVEDTIDFNFTNKDAFTSTEVWADNNAAGKKYSDLKEIRLEIIKKSGVNPDVVVMANDVVELFLNDDSIQKLFDIRNFSFGQMQPRVMMDGVTYIGTLASLGLEIYTYDEWFIDDDGVEKPMMPDNYLIMGRTGLGSRLYGAVTQLEDDGQFHTYEGTRIPKVWNDTNNDMKMIRVASRPLPKPEDVDSWYVLKVK